jgi:hypothetical protein
LRYAVGVFDGTESRKHLPWVYHSQMEASMKFLVMDYSGHTTHEFTAEEKLKGLEMFKALLEDGKTAATRSKGGTDYTVIRDPNKIEDETVFIPHRVGG